MRKDQFSAPSVTLSLENGLLHNAYVMHRNVVGALAILFVVSGLVLLRFSGYLITGQGIGHAGAGTFLGGVLWKVGIVLGAIWLAMPARADQINWSRVITRAGLILVALFLISRLKAMLLLRLLPVAAGIGLLIYLLRPRPKGRRPRR
jgi:hypothetical protein